MNTEEDVDVTSFTTKFTNTSRERDLLKIQVGELEKALAVSESKLDHLRTEYNRVTAQLDSAKSAIVEKETVIQGIGATIVAHLKKSDPQVAFRNGLKAVAEVVEGVTRSHEQSTLKTQ